MIIVCVYVCIYIYICILYTYICVDGYHQVSHFCTYLWGQKRLMGSWRSSPPQIFRSRQPIQGMNDEEMLLFESLRGRWVERVISIIEVEQLNMIPNCYFCSNSGSLVCKLQIALLLLLLLARHPLADIDVGVAEGTVGDAGTLADWKQNSNPAIRNIQTSKSS